MKQRLPGIFYGHKNAPSYLAPYLLLLLGCLARLIVFFQNRSLHMDEASLARNIIEKSYDAFFQPLAYQQYAPPFFLAFAKSQLALFGTNEMALRLVSLITGCLLLWLWLRVDWKLGNTLWLSVFGFFLLAFSPLFIRYSTEVKQYACDAAVMMGLIWLTLQNEALPGRKNQIIWAIGGMAVIWLSMPAVFGLAGVGAYFLYLNWQKTGLKNLASWMVVIGCWLFSFGLYYFLLLKQDLANQDLTSYHNDYFLPLLPLDQAAWSQLAYLIWLLLRNTFGFTIVAITIGSVFLLLGIFQQLLRKPSDLLLLLVPVFSCLFASGLGYYSLMPRLTLFFLPILLLLFSSGIHFAWNHLKGFWKLLLTLPLFLMLPLQDGYEYLWGDKLEIEELRPLLDQLADVYQEDQSVLVHTSANSAYQFYTELYEGYSKYTFKHQHFVEWKDGPDSTIVKTNGFRERWFVFSHQTSDEAAALRDSYLKAAEKKAQKLMEINTPGAVATLFRFESEGE